MSAVALAKAEAKPVPTGRSGGIYSNTLAASQTAYLAQFTTHALVSCLLSLVPFSPSRLRGFVVTSQLCKTNPIPNTPKSPQPPAPQGLTPTFRPTRSKKTNPNKPNSSGALPSPHCSSRRRANSSALPSVFSLWLCPSCLRAFVAYPVAHACPVGAPGLSSLCSLCPLWLSSSCFGAFVAYFSAKGSVFGRTRTSVVNWYWPISPPSNVNSTK